MENWGFSIKRLREERGWTQFELAHRSGISRSYVAKIETGLSKAPAQDTFSALANAFDMSLDEMQEIMTGKKPKSRQETPEQILERLRVAQPISIPIYTEFPFHAGEPVEPVDYVYRARSRGAPRNIEGYIVHGNCLEPTINNGDIIIVDREGSIDEGNIIAALISGEIHLGKLRKIAGELYLENKHGRIKLEDCQVVAPVIEMIRRLK